MKKQFYLNQLYRCSVYYTIGSLVEYFQYFIFTNPSEARLFLSMYRHIPGCYLKCDTDMMQVLDVCDSPYNFVNVAYSYFL